MDINIWRTSFLVLVFLATLAASASRDYTARQYVAPIIYAGNPRYFNTRHQSYVTPRRASLETRRTPTNHPVTPTQHQKNVVSRIASKQRGGSSSGSGSRSSKRRLLYNTFRKFEKTGNVTDVIRKLERVFHYAPSLQESVNSMRSQISKNNKRSKLQFLRIFKDIFSIQSRLRETNSMCESYSNNINLNARKITRLNMEYKNYRREAINKTAHIESHQKTQDLRHFEVAELATNNSADISQLKSSTELLREIFDIVGSEDKDEVVDQKARREIKHLKVELNNQENEQSVFMENFENELETIRRGQAQSGRLDRFELRIVQQTRAINNIQAALNMHTQKLERLKEIATTNNNDDWFLGQQLNIRQTGSPDTTNVRESPGNLTVAVEHNWVKNIEQDSKILENHQHILDLNDAVIQHQEETINSSDVTYNTTSSSSAHALHHQRSRFQGLTGTRDLWKRLQGTGFDDRLDRMSRSLRYHSTKLHNVTSLIDSITDDVSSLSITTSNYFNIINNQAKQIQRQNETIVELTDKVLDHEQVIRNMAGDMAYQQDTIMKLMTIVTNLGQFVRHPIPDYKDCHDLWNSGHMKSGVYTIVRNMNTFLVNCNMTANGGWTILQQRSDGTQDFDLEWKDYINGFGNIYGEFWLGLDAIRKLTHSRMYTLKILMEDWSGKITQATYEQFVVYGQKYILSVKGYTGDSGDTLAASNGRPFKVRTSSREQSITRYSDCPETRRAGWWFARNCGVANPNGPYPVSRSDKFEAPTPRYLSVYWMSWKGKRSPLKRISMQVMPQEVLVERNLKEKTQEVVEPSPEDADEDTDDEYLDANYERGEEYNYRQISIQGSK